LTLQRRLLLCLLPSAQWHQPLPNPHLLLLLLLLRVTREPLLPCTCRCSWLLPLRQVLDAWVSPPWAAGMTQQVLQLGHHLPEVGAQPWLLVHAGSGQQGQGDRRPGGEEGEAAAGDVAASTADLVGRLAVVQLPQHHAEGVYIRSLES
jgi:hypothetical protein